MSKNNSLKIQVCVCDLHEETDLISFFKSLSGEILRVVGDL